MTPERMAALVAWWVRFYTRNLPPATAERRMDEIDADVHDHIAHERARGIGDRRIALSVLGRMLRGLPADVSYTPGARIVLATAFVLLLPLIAMQFTDEVDWGVFDFVFAGVLLAGSGLLLQRLAAGRTGNVVLGAAAIVIGVAAVLIGEADDAPGLVGFGGLLIIATVALVVRTAQRSE
jgi:hypothetical protein